MLEVPQMSYYNRSMKKIEKVFIKTGFRHQQVVRKKDYAIYKRTQLGSGNSHYEVVKIGKHNGYKLGSSYIEPSETYPGNSLWGIQGWTCQTLDAAEERFNMLLTKANGKKKVKV